MFKDEQEITFSSDVYTPDTTVTFYAVWSTQEQEDEDPTEYSNGSQMLVETENGQSLSVIYTEDGEAVFQVTDA